MSRLYLRSEPLTRQGCNVAPLRVGELRNQGAPCCRPWSIRPLAVLEMVALGAKRDDIRERVGLPAVHEGSAMVNLNRHGDDAPAGPAPEAVPLQRGLSSRLPSSPIQRRMGPAHPATAYRRTGLGCASTRSARPQAITSADSASMRPL